MLFEEINKFKSPRIIYKDDLSIIARISNVDDIKLISLVGNNTIYVLLTKNSSSIGLHRVARHVFHFANDIFNIGYNSDKLTAAQLKAICDDYDVNGKDIIERGSEWRFFSKSEKLQFLEKYKALPADYKINLLSNNNFLKKILNSTYLNEFLIINSPHGTRIIESVWKKLNLATRLYLINNHQNTLKDYLGHLPKLFSHKEEIIAWFNKTNSIFSIPENNVVLLSKKQKQKALRLNKDNLTLLNSMNSNYFSKNIFKNLGNKKFLNIFVDKLPLENIERLIAAL